MLRGPLAVRVDIVDDNEQSVDEIGHFLPASGSLTVTAVECRCADPPELNHCQRDSRYTRIGQEDSTKQRYHTPEQVIRKLA